MIESAAPERLAEGVRTVAEGEALLDPTLTRRLVERFVRLHRPRAPGASASPS